MDLEVRRRQEEKENAERYSMIPYHFRIKWRERLPGSITGGTSRLGGRSEPGGDGSSLRGLGPLYTTGSS